jgi:hypothetical protein
VKSLSLERVSNPIAPKDNILSNSIYASMNHSLTVNSKQLATLMFLLVAGPIALGLYLFVSGEPQGEPPLLAEIQFETTWVGTDTENPRLVPSIRVKNLVDHPLSKLSIGLNRQFYSTGNGTVDALGEVSVPLESFIARNGSVRFPVGKREIKTVIVMAQIESGARGISEYSIVPPNLSTPSAWIQPMSKPNPSPKR